MVHCFFVIARSKDMAHRWRARARLCRVMDSVDYIIFWQSVNRAARSKPSHISHCVKNGRGI